MNNSINKLLQTEEEIANIYSELPILEYNNETERFEMFRNTLKNKIDDEEKLFDILTEEDLIILNDDSFLTKKLKGHHPEYNIKNRINKKIMFLFAEKELTQLDNKIVIDAISSETKDIYFSFLDEEINRASNNDRAFLIKEKYKIIYDLEDVDEKRLLSRGFHTDRSLYLYSKMYADASQININLYNIYKFSIALGMLKEINEKIKNNKNCLNGPYKYVVLSQIRTNMLLLNRKEYLEVLKKINENDALPLLLNNLFRDNYIKVLEQDKERHKVLSLVPKDPYE